VLRPGGVFYPMEGRMRRPLPPASAFGVFQGWWVRRWNYEVWQEHYVLADYPARLAEAGFAVSDNRASAKAGTANIMGTKPA
jgi:hypothetical protein